uniref:Uncharacterized protein n=1 Tax=viral metagenome TaxID=1070528 RepID=A0A6M3LRR2_9ZZZZ
MKQFKALGEKKVLYEVIVFAKSRSEAIKRIRAGSVDHYKIVHQSKGFALGGGGNTGVEEVV